MFTIDVSQRYDLFKKVILRREELNDQRKPGQLFHNIKLLHDSETNKLLRVKKVIPSYYGEQRLGGDNHFSLNKKLHSSFVKCDKHTLNASFASLQSIILYILHDSSIRHSFFFFLPFSSVQSSQPFDRHSTSDQCNILLVSTDMCSIHHNAIDSSCTVFQNLR